MKEAAILFLSTFAVSAAFALIIVRREIAARYRRINRLNRAENAMCDEDRSGREAL